MRQHVIRNGTQNESKLDMMIRDATECFKAVHKIMTKVILGWTDERGGCKNAPPEVEKASTDRKTGRRAESESMHPKGVPPWPSVY
jgi:hypothetical protein